mmetsp:Transcript_17477/g.29416  ORF Transcript_17477/g.29416 Transcript_17477/m.29416 type:complete len:146 (-) Transcript_17477:793-1230(-)
MKYNGSLLQSTVSDRMRMGHSGGGGGGGGAKAFSTMGPSHALSLTTNSIKPSVSFISMGRKDYKQLKYTEENKGPSPLQLLGNEKAFKDKFSDRMTLYEQERDHHLKSVVDKTKLLQDARELLYPELTKQPQRFVSPKHRREEIR